MHDQVALALKNVRSTRDISQHRLKQCDSDGIDPQFQQIGRITTLPHYNEMDDAKKRDRTKRKNTQRQ